MTASHRMNKKNKWNFTFATIIQLLRGRENGTALPILFKQWSGYEPAPTEIIEHINILGEHIGSPKHPNA